MEPHIPWWVIVAITTVLGLPIGTITMHAPKSGEPATKADLQNIEKLLDSRLFQVQNIKSAISRLPKEPLGSDGTTYTDLPEGSRIVTMADGSIRLALPVSLKLTSGGEISGSVSMSSTVKKRGT